MGPDINGAPVCCAKCRQPVQITCVEHGADCVLELNPLPRQAVIPSDMGAVKRQTLRSPDGPRPVARASRAGGNSIRARMVAMVSTDQSRPTITQDVVDGLQITPAHAAVELAFLTKQGLLQRVKRGQYIQASAGAE